MRGMEKTSRTATDRLLADLEPAARDAVARFLVAPDATGWELIRDLPLAPHRSLGHTVVLYGFVPADAVPSPEVVLDVLMPIRSRGWALAA